MEGKQVPLGYSLYLDALRFIAAAAVFISHTAQYPFVPKSPAVPGPACSPTARPP